MVEYKMIIEMKFDRFFGFYETCGIEILENDTVVRTVKDIHTEKNKIGELVRLMNEEQLAPSHLDQVLEEFLYDFEVK